MHRKCTNISNWIIFIEYNLHPDIIGQPVYYTVVPGKGFVDLILFCTDFLVNFSLLMAQPVDPPPLYPQLESIYEKKDTQIEEVENNFLLIQNKLIEKKNSIISRIKNANPIEDPQIQNLQKQLISLYISKKNLKDSMANLQLASTLAESYAKIEEQIIRIEKQLHTVKYLRWYMADCENAIDNLCVVCEGKDLAEIYSRKKELLWESVAPGAERTQVNGPVGLAIEPKTDHIFIADAGNNRIQVYNSGGKHLSQIKLAQSWKILFIDFLGDILFIVGEFLVPHINIILTWNICVRYD